MTTYATQADIVALYNEDALVVAERGDDGAVDQNAIARALEMATGEINSFIGVRYPLPLASVPLLLTQHCVDIALYRLANTADLVSEEHRTRYEDAIAHLKLVSTGKAILNIPKADDDAPEEGGVSSNTPRPIVVGGPAREFTREKMRGL